MKYSTILLGAFATLGLVQAFAAPEAYPGGVEEDDFSDEFTDCEESGPVSSLIPISSGAVVAPPSITTTTTTKKHHHHHHTPPVITKTIIIIVETFTRFCPGPTTISEGTVTVTVTEPTIITFSSGGPFTRTKTILECFTTTTEFFFEEECGCKGWPFATGHDFTPLVIPETETAPTPTGPVIAAGGAPAPTGTSFPKAPVVTAPNAAGSPAGTGAVVFTGIGSKMTTGFFGVVAGVVAIMVL
jgi:hypothetical protein